jgi:hypothetical protein
MTALCNSLFAILDPRGLRRMAALALTPFLLIAAHAQTTNLYTKPEASASGGISGQINQELTHAIALEHNRVSCYKAELSGGKAFRFTGLPTGKYDLVLITKTGCVYEGVMLGDDASKLSPAALKHVEESVAKADTFFNKYKIERMGLIDNGERLLAFVERLRDLQILKQSGEVLKSNLRRFEVIDFTKAGDDWQMMTNRHLYREEQPLGPNMAFCKHAFVPELMGIRVIDSVKDIGSVALPPAL